MTKLERQHCGWCGTEVGTRQPGLFNPALGPVAAWHKDRVGVFEWSKDCTCPGSFRETMETKSRRVA